MQTEMFDELPHNDENNQPGSTLFNIKFLKGIKVELSFDVIIILGIIFMLFCISSYFMGIQKGKNFYLKKALIPEDLQVKEVTVIEEVKKVEPAPVAIPAPVPVISPVPAPAPAPVAAPGKEEYKYTIQIGASRDKDAAIKDINKLKAKGYDAFISISQSSNGKNWYKICVGKFAKSKDSSKIKNDLKFKENYNNSFLTRL